MVTHLQLGPTEFLDALEAVAVVLGDHAAALDRLELGDAWVEGDDAADLDDPASVDEGAEADRRTVASNGELLAGTDLARTVAAAVALARSESGLWSIADALVRGSRDGAGGPAGRDLVVVFSGFADALRNADHVDAQRFAIGLEIGAEGLTIADDGSHAGCLPSVVAAAADGALSAVDDGADLAETVIAAADDGLVELESGPVANPSLVERGVVDAAAAGFLLLLDVLASIITGEPLPSPPVEIAQPASDGRRYEVRCRIEPHQGCGIESANWLESAWFELGDLAEFDGISPVWRAAVVTASPGAAVEALFEVGRPRDLHIALAPSET